MAKFFHKLKKQKSKNSAENESPPVTSSSVGTQSEPLPTSFHLDGLLNYSVGEDGGLRRQRSAFEEDVDGAMFSPVGALAEGGGGGGHRPLCLPPPLIPSPPFTLSRSPTPQLDTTHHFQLPPPPSSRQLSATPSRSTPSPTFPPVSSGQRRQQKSGNFTPASSGGQRKSLTFSPVSSAERNNSIHRQNSGVQTSTPTSTCGPGGGRGSKGEDGEEARQCHAALRALEMREKRLMAEVTDLRTELRGIKQPTPPPPPHPESVVAELEESLRAAEEAVQAVQGERDDLREGVEKMKDELVSLQRSNSLLAQRKQQWMEVASQTRVVLEENHNLMSQYKAAQSTISDLRTKHYTKVAELEGELAGLNEVKRSLEYEVGQLSEGQALLLHQISRLLGVSPSHRDSSVQHVASLLERHGHDQRQQLAAWQEQTACLEREKQVLVGKVEEAKAVTRRLEGELGLVQSVVREGEETVARLRDQLEELHEREEATQLQLAHALAQVDKTMSERDIYARVAKRWQAMGESGSTKALDEAQHQLKVQAAQHRAQRRRYKTEIHQLKSHLSQEDSLGEGRRHTVSGKHKDQ